VTDLSVVIPAHNEGPNLALLLPAIRGVLDPLRIRYELIVVCRKVDDATAEAALASDAHAVEQVERGYGGALIKGFSMAQGEFVLTMDADLSHRPDFILDMWQHRNEAHVLIASRYVSGGRAIMPRSRYVLSRVLNTFFSRGLSLDLRDMSSGFRLYRNSALRALKLRARDFNVLQEILVNVYAEGWSVKEIPFTYRPREHGSSNANIWKFGIAYLKMFRGLWVLRNSILCADYDYRAYDSAIPLQKYWQRKRYQHIAELIAGQGPVLDVGCGSSHIIGLLPKGSLALDVLLRKVRFARRMSPNTIQGSGFALPVRDASFPCVLCSQVIEHVPKESPILEELIRTLAPGGRLVLGTPDYANWQWRWTEALYGFFAPNAYADEHIAHYTRKELIGAFEARGFKHEATRYILQGELILAFRKDA
jgi:dolichol-phosphate mannosyltransferase